MCRPRATWRRTSPGAISSRTSAISASVAVSADADQIDSLKKLGYISAETAAAKKGALGSEEGTPLLPLLSKYFCPEIST